MERRAYAADPVIIKAKELAEAIMTCPAYKKEQKKMQQLIRECNNIIVKMTNIDYGAICSMQSCCG